jgi:predicted PurR-regulated permease PerM
MTDAPADQTEVESNGERPASKPPEDSASGPPDIAQLGRTLKDSLSVVQASVLGLFVIALLFALDAAAGFIIPIVVAHLLDRLLTPLVRMMRKGGIPDPVGAAIVLLAFGGVVGVGVYYLSGPASEWIESAPRNLQIAEYKLRGLTESLEKMKEAAQEVDQATNVEGEGSQETVQVQEESMSETLMNQTQVFVSGLLITLFLLYFLLASGDLFLRKVVQVLPRFRHRRNAVRIIRRTEQDLTHYLSTVVLINTGLGIAIAGGMYLVGMPNPLLWGALGGVLNFVPYLGPLVNIAIVTVVALVSFESVMSALLAPLVYLIINGIEGSLVTPALMGMRLRLNPIVIFIGLTFWTWMWGIAGALLAVPLLATLKIACESIDLLQPIGVLMGR